VLAEESAIVIGQRRRHPVMQVVKAGVLYFTLMFGSGFVLGTIRTLWVIRRLGTRAAELVEMPIMLVVTIVAARWTVLRMSMTAVCPNRDGLHRTNPDAHRGVGFALWIRGISIRAYLATRDRVRYGLLPAARGVRRDAASGREGDKPTMMDAVFCITTG
jgi:hypothetical protein